MLRTGDCMVFGLSVKELITSIGQWFGLKEMLLVLHKILTAFKYLKYLVHFTETRQHI